MYDYHTSATAFASVEGQVHFIQSRDRILEAMKKTGALQMGYAFQHIKGFANSDLMMAVVDHMVVIGDLLEIPQNNPAGQHRVFILKPKQWAGA